MCGYGDKDRCCSGPGHLIGLLLCLGDTVSYGRDGKHAASRCHGLAVLICCSACMEHLHASTGLAEARQGT